MSRSTPAARLRRTFHYPSDDDDDGTSPFSSAGAVLDEQEQDSLIASLSAQNARRNATTHRFLYALPALSTIPFLLGLFLPPSPSSNTGGKGHHHHPSRLLSLLGLSSLLATAWLLFALGITETGFPLLDDNRGSGGGSRSEVQRRATTQSGGRGGRRRRDGLFEGGAAEDKSPLARHLPWLNVGLAALALLTGLLERVRLAGGGGVQTGGSGGVNPLLLGALPGVVYAVVVGAKVVMAGVDPERELSVLRYRYKGA